jgi:ABC-type multidrug transport system ATPase subunit
MAIFVPSPWQPADTARDAGAAITVRGLTRQFRGRVVLDRIDLTIGHGERAGVWGVNGSGKTTLRCLAGTLTPSAGQALVLGYRQDHARPAAPAAISPTPRWESRSFWSSRPRPSA